MWQLHHIIVQILVTQISTQIALANLSVSSFQAKSQT